MAILDFLTGEFIDVIAWTDDTRDTMVWRFERRGNAIKYGAKLTVREGQAAVFVHEGQIADVFGPGLYMLETNNMPILTTLQNWDHGFRSPFKSEIYFVNTTRFNDQKWGTKNPIIARDPEFGPVRLRAFGTYSMRVSDPGRFISEIVGTDGEFTADEISFQIRNVIVQEFSRVIASSGLPVLDMAANTADLGKLVAKAIQPTIAAYGLTIPEFYIENISLPDEVEKVLDKRTSMGIVGDLNRWNQYAAGDAAMAGARVPGSGFGTGMGTMIGMQVGGGMMAPQPQPAQTQGPWGAVQQPAPGAQQQPAGPLPPPLPGRQAETVWHIAREGEADGPYGRGHLGRLAREGSFTRDTLVWTPGQNGWEKAEDVPELAQLFTISPPPPPIPAAPSDPAKG
ncbi:SPFH domain-containing protein [Paracoccus pacificus]|uniref:SPFH domain-containing protein n=1 Tax=Paracoccus pacificus TaxID=1463598 RepID=A0ABW4RAI8_9RHOB